LEDYTHSGLKEDELVDANKARNFAQSKIVAAHYVLHKLSQRYGSSCYLQLLDDEPAPLEERATTVARAPAKR